jgi:hypothetical protein
MICTKIIKDQCRNQRRDGVQGPDSRGKGSTYATIRQKALDNVSTMTRGNGLEFRAGGRSVSSLSYDKGPRWRGLSMR